MTGPAHPPPAAPPGALTPLEAAVLAEIQPTPEEEEGMRETALRLEAACAAALRQAGVPGTATVQGSVAKGTWLRGAGDIDLFLLLDPGVPEGRLEGVAEAVAAAVLSGARKRYAQHPYLVGAFGPFQVDLVPAYRVGAATARMSAVDRTPFHTAWVRGRLDAAGRAQARLLKRWMKGTGAYGAQTSVGGFSGYLAEVLVAAHGGFAGVLDWLAAGARPRRLALGPDQVEDAVSPLVVVDPVDPARNCAAAVQEGTLERAIEAARAYRQAPARAFFFPAPPCADGPAALRAALDAQGATWLGALLRPRTGRLDIVFPQFQKGARALAAALAQAGFPTPRLSCLAAPDEKEVLLQWLCAARELPEVRTHHGPAAQAGAHADRFRAKWEGHPDAVGHVRATPGGRLEVDVRVPQRTAPAWLAAHLRQVPVGRHVADALDGARALDDPAAVPPEWAADVAEFVTGRRPWQR